MNYNHRELLSAAQIRYLRDANKISDKEYAFVAGDLLVAENVQTSEKRVLGTASELLNEQSSKRVLKG